MCDCHLIKIGSNAFSGYNDLSRLPSISPCHAPRGTNTNGYKRLSTDDEIIYIDFV